MCFDLLVVIVAGEGRVALGHYMDASLAEGDLVGHVTVLPQGAAIWAWKTNAVATQSKCQRLGEVLGAPGLAMYRRIVEAMDQQSTPHVRPEWFYLSILGVDPAAQRQGVGARLLAPMLARADAEQQTCWLETYTDNHGFYHRLGFRPAVQLTEATTQSSYWVLVRPPAPMLAAAAASS